MLTGTYDAVVVGARCAGSPTAMLLAQKGDPHPRRAHRRALRMAGGGEFLANRSDIEGNFLAAIDLAPEFAECVHAATRESKFVGSADLPGYVRKPFGPGWALMGDAGYHKNPITAMGINDAFRDAELLADALDDAFSGRRPYDEAMTGHQQARDREALPVYEFTDDFAQLRPRPPALQQLLAAMRGNQEAMDGFVSVQANTLPAPEFFEPGNIAHIMGAAPAPSTGSGGSRPAGAPSA
jgi:flavin-dependent dehydrogenase